ncbi:hypothetical protein HN873_058607, partial [Arachis hypogaea]
PDNFTLPCAVKAYAGLTEVKLGEALHALALKLGLCSDSFVGNVLIAMYSKCGFVESAFKVFEKMSQRYLVSWNSIMLVCSKNGLFGEICGLFKGLLLNGGGNESSVPDVATTITMVFVVAATATTKAKIEAEGRKQKQKSRSNNRARWRRDLTPAAATGQGSVSSLGGAEPTNNRH